MNFNVSEIFGPTIQGEGFDCGRCSYFIRFPFCDFDCEWCDTKEYLKTKEIKSMTIKNIIDELKQLGIERYSDPLIIFTGGNPLLENNLHHLMIELKTEFNNLEISCETQGSYYNKKCVPYFDYITISPKLKSSGEYDHAFSKIDELLSFFTINKKDHFNCCENIYLKFVIDTKNEETISKDFESILNYMARIYYHMNIDIKKYDTFEITHNPFPKIKGVIFQPVTNFKNNDKLELLDSYNILIDKIMSSQEILRNIRSKIKILPQLHYLVWGNKNGV